MMNTKTEFLELLCKGYLFRVQSLSLVFIKESNELLDARGMMDQLKIVEFINVGIPADYI